mmetsp:Transcript_29161/g.37619  ORF Transcript_29161/g.37619 Transcript_29161/m.37619 type:complete len:145 (+) Transcript_29161:73-507(+)
MFKSFLFSIIICIVHSTECPLSKRTVSFLVDQQPHQIIFDSLTFGVDGISIHLHNKSWDSMARASLSHLGIHNNIYSASLAKVLEDFNESFSDSVLQACRLRHFNHGGLGLLAEEDYQLLLGDECCQEVAEDLLQFYRGSDTLE